MHHLDANFSKTPVSYIQDRFVCIKMTLRTYTYKHTRTQMHHLDANLSKTPVTYIQDRFFHGRDKELSKMVTLALTEDEEALRVSFIRVTMIEFMHI